MIHQGRIITNNYNNNSFQQLKAQEEQLITTQRERYKKSSLNNFNDRLKKSNSKLSFIQ